MQAEAAVQLRLLDLQGLDLRIAQLQHRRATLPEIARLAELEVRNRGLRDRLVAAATIVSDLEREQAKAEADVDQVRQRIARDRDLLDSGRVSTAKQLTDLQHEVESLRHRQDDLEDVELAVMERLDGAQQAVGVFTAEGEELADQLAAVQAAQQMASRDIDAEVAGLHRDRESLAGELPADLIALYDRLRAEQAGIGVARMHRGRCEGCRIQLTAMDIGRLRVADPTEVVRCEECRRILVRTPESGL